MRLAEPFWEAACEVRRLCHVAGSWAQLQLGRWVAAGLMHEYQQRI